MYLATTADGISVALKVCRAISQTAQHNFLREFESLRLLQAPGIVQVREAGIDGDCLWFSMERIFGRPFHHDLLQIDYASERVEQTVQRSIRLLSTLTTLHETGFAHRDLKPSNVLVDAGGIPHVLDFGVSKWFQNEGTTANIIVGTIPYMAPEQMGGLHTGTAADLFAVGLMMHEAIAGLPKSPATPMGWVVQTCLEQRLPLATVYREVPLALSALVEDMTHVDPVRRPTAAQALLILRQIGKGQGKRQWPSPRFVDPGPWFGNLEDAVGERKFVVLEGPSGSGKRRVVDQIHRQCLLEGRWTVHLRCEAHIIGAPWLQLLQTVSRTLREGQVQEIVGEDGQAVGALWPHLGLPRDATLPTTGGALNALKALTRIIRRLCASTPILLAVEQLEQIDGFSARILLSLASAQVPIIVLYDPRWATQRSTAVTRRLLRQPRSMRIVARPPVDAGEIAQTVHPSAPKQIPAGTSAIQAAAIGWRALGNWRNSPWDTPVAPLRALAILQHPMPMPVMRTLCGKALEQSRWVEPGRGGAILAEGNTRAWLLASLSDRSVLAAKVVSVWESAMGAQADPRRLAQLWLIAGQEPKALEHAVRAAVQADRQGNYTDARQWVLLAESIGLEQLSESTQFALAHVTARVALRTDAKIPRTSLIHRASSLAHRGNQRLMVQLVDAEYGIRSGDARAALTGALHVSVNHKMAPRTAARALLVCVHARILLDDIPGAVRELSRAQDLIVELDAPYLEVQAMSWAAEIKWHQAEYDGCRRWSAAAIKKANKYNYPRGMAFPSARLSTLLRMRGDRRAAERFARKALSAFERTG
ncbi:MAG: protein kinase, partial [Rhodobacterales bacterium]|nr:protein kinase [Rhodobacterales bacterium]